LLLHLREGRKGRKKKGGLAAPSARGGGAKRKRRGGEKGGEERECAREKPFPTQFCRPPPSEPMKKEILKRGKKGKEKEEKKKKKKADKTSFQPFIISIRLRCQVEKKKKSRGKKSRGKGGKKKKGGGKEGVQLVSCFLFFP